LCKAEKIFAQNLIDPARAMTARSKEARQRTKLIWTGELGYERQDIRAFAGRCDAGRGPAA
jgi:hypothetical protein